MSSPLPYLIRMLVFLAGVAGLAYVLHEDLIRIFQHTPTLDSVILGVLVLGIFFVFRQVIILWPEVSWMRRYRNRDADSPVPPSESVNLLAPLAAMLGERNDRIRLSPTATRAVLDGIATRLDERRELARYMIGLLIFLGLLGTFWGLLQTIASVADAINSLQVSAGDAVQMFAKLKTSIEGPLTGMSTAFGASLFGLSGSLVLGFLELQASQAQGRFHIELEEWLARATSLSTSSLPPGVAQSVPAYVEALLERNTEGVDGLMRSIHRIEESRQAAAAGNATLVERLAALAETMRAQQNLLARFTELSIELRTALARLSERAIDDDAEREEARAHRRAIEGHLGRLVEESLRTRGTLADEIAKASNAHREALEARIAELGAEASTHRQQLSAELERLHQESMSGRAQVSEELRRAVARLSDRSAAEADREAMANLQHAVEGQLARVVDESGRARTALADELRNAVGQLADRFADVDREAMALHRRNIEAHLARLVEETATNRTAVAEEIRGEIRLLARTIALAREPAPAQEQPTGD
ncbi:MAG: flagellar motor protein MotA [Proteobacteria bacterium]|nr:flagellar motor protein MotA [Pseudomonadota bacterium]